VDTGWPLFALGIVFAATTAVLVLAGLGAPLLFVAAGLTAVGSYACLQRSRSRLTERVYARVGVERNPDGTVGQEGRAVTPSRSADIDYEPRDDWDDPDDWPFDDPFWLGEEAGAEARTEQPPGPDEGPAEWWGRHTGTSPSHDGGSTTFAPREREACDVLGVDLNASVEEITAAYREQVLETHPDHGGDETAFKRVRWAYEYLKEHRAPPESGGISRP